MSPEWLEERYAEPMSEVKSIAVIGAGTMGSGITMTAAISGLEAWQVDVSQEQLDRARAYHQKNLARNVAKERMTQQQADEAAARQQVELLSDRLLANPVIENWTLELKLS